MRRARFRRWIAPSRCCPCSLACPSGAPMTTSATAPPPCSPHWRSPPARSPASARTATAIRNSCDSSNTLPAPTPTSELHLVMDNYAAHKRVEIRDWLAANPRIHVHFTPTSASWLNLVEVWFGIIERQAIHRGTFGNVRELTTAIKKLHRRLERPGPPVRLDQNSRPNPQESKPSTNFKHGPLVLLSAPAATVPLVPRRPPTTESDPYCSAAN